MFSSINYSSASETSGIKIAHPMAYEDFKVLYKDEDFKVLYKDEDFKVFYKVLKCYEK